ncbi:MAG: hypothetical protein RJA99_848 [Pseudomonadota bacterium]|jgi:hypothetical protein
MSASAVQPAAVASSRLGVPGLSEAVSSLARGLVYGLAADAQPLRLPLIAQSLRASLSVGRRCTLLVPGDPAVFLTKARLAGIDLSWHERSGDLVLVRQRTDPLLPLFRAGPQPVLEQIDRLVGADRDLLLIDQADPLLFLSDPAQAEQACEGLRRWAARRDLTVLAFFTPGVRPQRESLTLRANAEDFAGWAALREHDGGAILDLMHWFAQGGSAARGSLRLRVQGAGELVVDLPAGAPARPADAGPAQVAVMDSAVDDPVAAVRDASWSVVSTHAEALEAARPLTAGAVVLTYAPDTPFRALCHAACAIRRVASPWVSLLVRERGMRLRLVQQVALARLGVTAVVPTGADDADLAQTINALAGTAFQRTLPDDVEATIAQSGTLAAPQLMVTRAFRDTVAEVLGTAGASELPHALLHVACDPARAQQLGTFALQRKIRDAAMTVDPTGLWVFLFGCPASRAQRVAERTFARYYAEIASSITVEGTVGGIARRLERLAGAVGLRDGDTVRMAASATEAHDDPVR